MLFDLFLIFFTTLHVYSRIFKVFDFFLTDFDAFFTVIDVFRCIFDIFDGFGENFKSF